MGYIISFDNVTMRWLNEMSGDPGLQNSYGASNTFKSGYEDPTYMTFRIEFGGWGASTMSKEAFREIQRTNSRSSDSIRKVYSFNYDDYPQGLLDLNFAKHEIKDFPYYGFNEQGTYNAYNWLLHRNEDARAAYMKAFIEGLYEIQQDYPYIFHEISGLDGLSSFDPTKGQRIDHETVLTLKCIEGLSRKMYTLMQLYSKAAWDAEYQRWILPENYRQFKMILYVFERRVFHSAAESSTLDNTTNDQKKGSNFGSQVVDFLLSGTSEAPYGPVSKSQTTYVTNTVNALLPVMAYECNMCEFMINSFGAPDSLNVAWDDTTQTETTISIKVRNVRTYYKNGLLKHLSNMVVGDMVTSAERDYDPEDETQNPQGNYSYIQLYLDRNMTYINDVGNIVRHPFGGGGQGSADPNSLRGAFDSMVNGWKDVLGKKSKGSALADSNAGIDPNSYAAIRDSYLSAHDLTGYRNTNWWYNATMDPGKLSGSFWKKLWKTIKAGTQHIRVPPGYANVQAGIYYNILDFINYDNTLAGAYLSYATRSSFSLSGKERRQMRQGGYTEVPNESKYKSTATYDMSLDDTKRKSITDNMEHIDDAYTGEEPNPNDMDSLVDKHKNLLDDFYAQGSKIGDPSVEMTVPTDGYEFVPDEKLAPEVERAETIEYPTDVLPPYEYPEYVYPNEEMDTFVDIPDPSMPPMSGHLSKGVNPPILNIAGKYKYPEYSYPNSQMETVEVPEFNPDLSGGSIDRSEGFAHDAEKIDSDYNMTGIQVVDKDGEEGFLLPVERPDIVLSKEDNIILDFAVARDIISQATSVQDMEFVRMDTQFQKVESMIQDIIGDADSMTGLKPGVGFGKDASIEQMMAELGKDSKNIKSQAVAHIAEIQEQLKSASVAAIESADKLTVSKATTANDLEKTYIEVPQAVINQLEDNIALFSIPRPALGNMSLQTMIGIENGLESALMNTAAMVEVMRMPDDRSMATDLDGGPDTKSMSQGRVERKTYDGTTLIG